MMSSIKNSVLKFKAVFFTLLLALITACSGGGESTGPLEDGTGPTGGISGTGIQLKGTAQKRSLYAVNQVQVKTIGDQIVQASLDANGQFSFSDLPDSPPYLLKVDFASGAPFYALTYAQNGRQNIHAYSDLAIRNWYAAQGVDVSDVFNGSRDEIPTKAELDRQNEVIANLTAPALAVYDLTDVDLSTVEFLSNDIGVDDFLDSNPVVIINGNVNIVITEPITNFQTSITNNLPLNTDLTLQDVNLPGQPERLRALPAEGAEIVLAWDASIDDVGVSQYQILRDGAEIGTSTFPFFVDTTVILGNVYTYTIVAIDASGNRSIGSEPAEADVRVDVTAPPAPINISFEQTDDSIRLSWQVMSIDDVSSFILLSGSDELANTSSTFAYQTDLTSGTEYCYQVIAVDGSNNKSGPSTLACTTTTQSGVVVAEEIVPEPLEEVSIVGSWGGLVLVDMVDVPAVFNIVAAADGSLSGDFNFPTLSLCNASMTFVSKESQTYEFFQNRRFSSGDCVSSARITFSVSTVGAEPMLEYQYYDPSNGIVSREGMLSKRQIAPSDVASGSWGGIVNTEFGEVPAIFNIVAAADGSVSGDFNFPTLSLCNAAMTFVFKENQTYEFFQNRRFSSGDCVFNARVNFSISTDGVEPMLSYQYFDPNNDMVSRTGTLSKRSIAPSDVAIGSWGGLVSTEFGEVQAIFNIAAAADGSVSGDFLFPALSLCNASMTFVLKSEQTYEFIQNRRFSSGDCAFNTRVNFTVSTVGSEPILAYQYFDPNTGAFTRTGTLRRR